MAERFQSPLEGLSLEDGWASREELFALLGGNSTTDPAQKRLLQTRVTVLSRKLVGWFTGNVERKERACRTVEQEDGPPLYYLLFTEFADAPRPDSRAFDQLAWDLPRLGKAEKQTLQAALDALGIESNQPASGLLSEVYLGAMAALAANAVPEPDAGLPAPGA